MPNAAGRTITVNAYDERHPNHLEMVTLECNTGLDISLLPDFDLEICIPAPEGPTDTVELFD